MAGNALNGLVLLTANLSKLARIPSRIATRAAASLTIQVHQDTASGLDCYGKPFADLAASTLAKGRRPPPMIDTGASLDATRFRPLGGAGIGMEIGGAYQYHLRASGTRPARQVAPVRAGIPATWNARIRREGQRAVAEACPQVAQ